jgi:murein DD-endopeptidase MepM/ murein hydrolase activator NlpD
VPRRFLLGLLAIALFAVTPAAGDIGGRKATVDAKIARLQDRIAVARMRETRLSSEIAGVTKQIRVLESRVGDVSDQLTVLRDDLALHQRRFDKLSELFRVQTDRFVFLTHEYRVTVRRLDERLVQIYKGGQPTTIDVVVNARNLEDLADQLDYIRAVINQNKDIAAQVGQAKHEVRIARAATRKAKAHVESEQRLIQARAQQVEAVRNDLLASKQHLSSARSHQQHALAATKADEREFIGEADALSKVSAELGAQIQAAQRSSGYSAPASSSGALAWPLSGPVTSPFGMRWGRMHEGIDIAASEGTPIHAAAAGRVIYCGWEEGYGNLVVLDNGNGVATAYAHQSSIAVSCGQDVAQGDVVGYVGSTGHSTGPHLHFEVRVNGVAVDPFGYL